MKTLMKYKQILAFCAFVGIMGVTALQGAHTESEHPPLSEDTKKAIAAYQHNPSEQNRQNLLNALNKAYDFVVSQKQEKLAMREREREANLAKWFNSIKRGQMPPFMEVDNDKNSEREAIQKAINAYRSNKNAANEKAIKSALESYYEAFLEEQRIHLKETQDLREERIKASFERFSSRDFKPSNANRGAKREAKTDEMLYEIVWNVISMGGEIVPVNPAARVREREYNAKINDAKKAYQANQNASNKVALKNAILEAFNGAFNARIEAVENAKKRGARAQEKLLEKLQDKAFLDSQIAEITEQRNLYGRIDRLITFGADTASNAYKARFSAESKRLYDLLQRSGDEGDKNALKAEFSAQYENLLSKIQEHLQRTKPQLESLSEQILDEMTR